jgi:hypothetical protein
MAPTNAADVAGQTLEQIGPFWKEVARQIFAAHAGSAPKGVLRN